MDVKLVRRLDRLLGTPVCGVLSAYERLRRPLRPPSSGAPRKILYVKLVEMGSTVLACPAFAEGANQVGADNIYLLVFERNRAIVDVLPYFDPDHVIAIDDTSLVGFAASLARALARVRREGIDAAVDLEGLPRASAIITYLTGAKARAGHFNFASEGPYRGRLFTHEVGYTFQHHTSGVFVGLVRALRGDVHDEPLLKERIDPDEFEYPRFEPQPTDRHAVTGLLTQAGVEDGTRLVLLNPNLCDMLPLRTWPRHGYLEFGRRLLEGFDDITLVVTGNTSEAEASQRRADEIGDRAVSLAGRTDMRQLLTLYDCSSLLVSSDSGPIHFASLTDVPIVALFGPETPNLYSPPGRRTTALTAELACSPCLSVLNHRHSICRDNRCMQAITVDQVLGAAAGYLRSQIRLRRASNLLR